MTKGNIYEKLTANDNKSYFGYLNKLVDECNNSYSNSTGKKPIKTNLRAPKFKLGDTVRVIK